MKNLIQKNSIHIPKFDSLTNKQIFVKILSFNMDRNNHFVLRLKVSNLNNDNYKLILKDNELTLILVESIELNRPIYTHNFKLNAKNESSYYENLKTIVFNLPKNNFHLINHEISGKNILRVVLGMIHYN